MEASIPLASTLVPASVLASAPASVPASGGGFSHRMSAARSSSVSVAGGGGMRCITTARSMTAVSSTQNWYRDRLMFAVPPGR